MSDTGFRDDLKKYIDQVCGRQKGGLWRSERQWYAAGGPDVDMKLKQVKGLAKIVRDELHEEGGMSVNRTMRLMGIAPMEIVLANPELFMDDDECIRFFKENNKFSSKG
jgi:hypothetical protein